MNKISNTAIICNLRKNIFFLLSATVTLLLFLSESMAMLMVETVILITAFLAAAWDKTTPSSHKHRLLNITAYFIALLIAVVGYDTFISIWSASPHVAELANALHLSVNMFLSYAAFAGCIGGFFAMYCMALWIVELTVQPALKKLPVRKKENIVSNLIINWYFPVSALAFFYTHSTYTLEYSIGLAIAVIFSAIFASQAGSLWSLTKKAHIGIRSLSVFIASGICWCARSANPVYISLNSISGIIGIFIHAAMFPFVYICITLFWKELLRIFAEAGTFSDLTKKEKVIYATMLLLALIYVAAAFGHTQAFYGTEYPYNIVYSSDSPDLVKNDVYVALTHGENDIRQPLFAVFAAPFVGLSYFASRVLGASAPVRAILINWAQVAMVFAANFMIARMFKFSPAKRVCFMAFSSFTYTYLLFILMMEQYIVAYFWLILCMYLVCEKNKPDRIALWGAGGTLLTSLALILFMSEKTLAKQFENWCKEIMQCATGFIAVMLAFCRFDIIFNLVSRIVFLEQFAGKNVTFADKLYQYTEYVRNCFFAPKAGVDFYYEGYITWQMNAVSNVSVVGIVILVLALLGALLDRTEKSSRLAAGWIGFSLIILMVLGWGVEENGLILYSLYFGWAFFALIFRLVDRIESILHIRFLLPAFCAISTLLMATVNIPHIIELIRFGIMYYPA